MTRVCGNCGVSLTNDQKSWCSRACYRDGILKRRLAQRKACAICGKQFARDDRTNHARWERRQCCGSICGARFAARTRWKDYKPPARPTRAQTLAKSKDQLRRYWEYQRILSAPKGRFETMEEFLARGGKVTRIEFPKLAPTGGVPTYPKYPSNSRRSAA